MYGELLTADSCRTREQAGIVYALDFLKSLENGLIVEVGVVVVHLVRVRAVIVHNIGGDTLAEVCLDSVNAKLSESLYL